MLQDGHKFSEVQIVLLRSTYNHTYIVIVDDVIVDGAFFLQVAMLHVVVVIKIRFL